MRLAACRSLCAEWRALRCRGCGKFQPGSVRPCWKSPERFPPDNRGLGRLDQRFHVGAAPGNQDGDALLLMLKAPDPLCKRRFRLGSRTSLPKPHDGFALVRSARAATCSAASASTTTIMPTPQLNVRSISLRRHAAGRGQPGKHRRHVDGRKVDFGRQVSGRTRGILSGKPPPVIWASALMPAPARGSPRAAISHRCASASAALRRASLPDQTARDRSSSRPESSTMRRTSEKPLE